MAGSEPDLSLARGVKDKPPSNQDVLLGTERELESPRGTADHVLPMVTQPPGLSWYTWRTSSNGQEESSKAMDGVRGDMVKLTGTENGLD